LETLEGNAVSGTKALFNHPAPTTSNSAASAEKPR